MAAPNPNEQEAVDICGICNGSIDPGERAILVATMGGEDEEEEGLTIEAAVHVLCAAQYVPPEVKKALGL